MILTRHDTTRHGTARHGTTRHDTTRPAAFVNSANDKEISKFNIRCWRMVKLASQSLYPPGTAPPLIRPTADQTPLKRERFLTIETRFLSYYGRSLVTIATELSTFLMCITLLLLLLLLLLVVVILWYCLV